MSINVKGEVLVQASGSALNETRNYHYIAHDGFLKRETRAVESQSDTNDYSEYRDSTDNGRTWGEWVRKKASTKERIGNDDYTDVRGYPFDQYKWNHIHKHYVSLLFEQVYVNGFEAATKDYWNGGQGESAHTYIEVLSEDKTQTTRTMAAYEDGASFSRDNYHTSDYLISNIGYGTGLTVLRNGDILFGMWTPMDVCCRIAGMDVNKVFPSAPKQPNGMLICRGKWNAETFSYELSFSEPIYLDDRQSSRGFSEPTLAELNSGKILVIFRASNVVMNHWNSRISPYAPNYKWYCLSDDHGKTFSPPMPWHFDTREVIYSPASYSILHRSTKNGKLYWIGNITDPLNTYGNDPRWPLQIVEVDEEWGVAKKKTLTVIDTRHEVETDQVQLSNFGLLEDRENGNIVLTLTKYCQYPDRHIRDCEVWKYTIEI